MLVRVTYFVVSKSGVQEGRSASFGEIDGKALHFKLSLEFDEEPNVEAVAQALQSQIEAMLLSANGKSYLFSQAQKEVLATKVLFAYPQAIGQRLDFRPSGRKHHGTG